MKEEVVCPRCRSLGTPRIKTVKGRKYVYVYHWDPYSEKARYCYIGPINRILQQGGMKKAKPIDLIIEG